MGKARSVKSFEVEALRNLKIAGGITRQSPELIGGPFSNDPSPIPAAIKSVRQDGGIMKGPLAFKESILTIATGVIDVARATPGFAGFIQIRAESGTTDDLTDINNPTWPQQELFLQADTGDTITIKTTGNIDTPDGADYTLSAEKIVHLIYSILSSSWVIVGTVSAGGSVAYPLEQTVTAKGNVTGAVTVNLSDDDGHVQSMTLTGDVTISFSNYPSSGESRDWRLYITQDSTGGHTITWPSEVVEKATVSTGAGKLTILTFTTIDGGTTVHVVPILRGSINLGGTGFATTELDNLTTTSINADLLPSATATRDIGSSSLFWSDVFTGTLNLGDPTDTQTLLGLSTGIQYNVKTGDSHIFAVNSVAEVQIDASSIFPTTSAVTNCGTSSLFWSNVYTGTLNLGDPTDTQTLVGTSSGITYNVKTGDEHQFSVNSVERLAINATSLDTTGDILPTITAADNIGSGALTYAAVFAVNFRFNTSTMFINGSASGMTFEVPTGDDFNWEVNNVDEMTLTSSDLDIHGNTLSGLTTLNWDDGNALASTPSEMNLTFPAVTDHFTWDFNSVERYEWGEGTAQVFGPATGSNLSWRFERVDPSPNDGDVIMQIDWEGKDSDSNIQEFVRMTFTQEDITTASEAGKWELDVATNTGALAGGIVVQGDANAGTGVGIGFLGAAALDKQTITGSRSGNAALANLLTALAGFGLILDSTSA